MLLRRSIYEPIRTELSYEALWEDADEGLIQCWERGRELAMRDPKLAAEAQRGALPVLPFKGGCETGLKMKSKFGTLYYLAMWQGLRGDDLDIDMAEPLLKVCAETGIAVTYTPDSSKWRTAT